jgi:hypothetical protein
MQTAKPRPLPHSRVCWRAPLPTKKTLIERELRMLRAGVKGEQEAAYLIDFQLNREDFQQEAGNRARTVEPGGTEIVATAAAWVVVAFFFRCLACRSCVLALIA